MSAALAALCGLMLLAAGRELIAERGSWIGPALAGLRESTHRRLPTARRLGPGWSPTGLRLARAGLAGLDPRALILARVLSGACSLPIALELAATAPGRSGPLVVAGAPIAATILPGLALDRLALARRARIESELPGALELMAAGAASGVGQWTLLARAAEAGGGALRGELLAAAAEIECGVPADPVLRALAERTGGEVAALARLLERSRRLGSPLAEGLQDQAVALRERRSRTIAERAEKAAPKIQLVVALLLVPSVLLLVAAAILANADLLLSGF